MCRTLALFIRMPHAANRKKPVKFARKLAECDITCVSKNYDVRSGKWSH